MLRYFLPLILCSVAACSSGGKPAATASSAGQSAYALHYGEELTQATKSIRDTQARAKTLSTGFSAYVDQLKKTNWPKVESIIDASDQAGRSTGFADTEGDAVAVKSFWESEKNEINGRVVGSAQAKLKEQGCAGDIGGTVVYSLNEGIAKQLQKRVRANNEAFVIIERNKVTLGPPNVPVLEKLADDVAEASYDVHVLMPTQRARIERLVADKSDVDKTLDRFVREETDLQAEPGRTEAEKKASSDRVTLANKAKSELDATASQAQATLKEMEKSIDAATKEYDEALKALKAKVDEKKKAEPPKEPGKT